MYVHQTVTGAARAFARQTTGARFGFVSIAVARCGVRAASVVVLLLFCGWRTTGIGLGSGDGQATTEGATAVLLISTNRESEYKLSAASDGVLFDIEGTGARHVAWPTNGSDVAFLAMDKNGDGRITSGKELIGSRFGSNALNSFTALQRLAMETNGGIKRGSVSSDDPVFSRLLLWYDLNRDGVSQAGELKSAGEVVTDIGVGYALGEYTDHDGNRFRARGWIHVRTAPGRNQVQSPEENIRRTRHVWEVLLTRK